MNRGTYTAANGMIAQQQRLDVLANNLANVNTRGFKGDRLTFNDMMLRTVADDAGYGEPIATLSSGPEADSKAQVTDFSPGGADVTGNPLDLRLGGRTPAMFAVRHNGEIRYTRDGAFKLNAGGDLVTRSGDAVLDASNQPIKGLTGLVKIDERGRIAGTPVEIGRSVGRFRKDEDGAGLYSGANVRPVSDADAAPIVAGELETSNVDPVLAMVDMISLQRSYEIAQKMVQSQDESTSKLAEAMS